MKMYRTPMFRIIDLTLSDAAPLCSTDLDASVDANFGSDFADTDEW